MNDTRMPAGPKRLPFVGNLFEFRRDPLGFLSQIARQYGDVCLFSIPLQNQIVLVNAPALIEEILIDKNRCFSKSSDYNLLKFVVGEGLLTSEGDFHRRQRRLAAPAFHRQ